MTTNYWLWLFLFASGPAYVLAAAPPSAPNFLFIFADDQAWSGTTVPMIPGNDLSRTAAFHMPNLDRLARQGKIGRAHRLNSSHRT